MPHNKSHGSDSSSGSLTGPHSLNNYRKFHEQASQFPELKSRDDGADGAHSTWDHHHIGRPWVPCKMWGPDLRSGHAVGPSTGVNQTTLPFLQPRFSCFKGLDSGTNGAHLTWVQVLGRLGVCLLLYGPDHPYSGPRGPHYPKCPYLFTSKS